MKTKLFQSILAGALAVAGLCRAATDDYMIVDLSSGIGSTNYPISYLSGIPGGSWSDDYKIGRASCRERV